MRQVLALVLLLALAASVCAQPVPSVQLTWDAPQPVAGVNITGYQLARCDLPVTATSCTCTPTPLAGAITNATTTTYTDSPAPGLYCSIDFQEMFREASMPLCPLAQASHSSGPSAP
jgi:hypothetical protein